MPVTAQSATIIAGDFHQEIAQRMIQAALAELASASVISVETITVAGSYELPIVADTVLSKRKSDIVVVLGYIEKGETLHGEVLGHVVYEKLLDLQLQYKTPIGLGIIGPGATKEQAHIRIEKTARGAVQAALRTLTTLRQI